MREIKFRAWEEFENGGGRMLNPSVNMSISSMHGDAWWQFGYDEPRPIEAIVMQFTGLKDKNGKEIYEGDMFQDEEDGAYNFVEWNEPMGGWGTNQWFLPKELVENAPTLEIIGNIYENPDLLK